MSNVRHGFTLIELLVVITIIVVFLSLLTPALDLAMYQAKVAACAARLDVHASTVLGYAMENRRAYPDRTATSAWSPWVVLLKGREQTGQWHDDRPQLFPFIRPILYLDPLCSEDIDLEDDTEGADSQTSAIASTYVHWYGWGYKGGGANAGSNRAMTRMGGQFNFNDERFNVLVTDQDWQTGSQSVGSHPDFSPTMMGLRELRNEPLLEGPNGPVLSIAGGFNFIMARWERRPADGRRGLIDSNHAFQDGSVRGYKAVPRDVVADDYGGPLRKVGVGQGSTVAQTVQGTYLQVPAN